MHLNNHDILFVKDCILFLRQSCFCQLGLGYNVQCIKTYEKAVNGEEEICYHLTIAVAHEQAYLQLIMKCTRAWMRGRSVDFGLIKVVG
jgi:hypothetical protein